VVDGEARKRRKSVDLPGVEGEEEADDEREEGGRRGRPQLFKWEALGTFRVRLLRLIRYLQYLLL
jgi:hypothetical protein